MTAYYNEFDKKSAAMLRQLIKDGLIAPGEVDERSIVEVKAEDVKEFTQCHWFAGIGGWSRALRLSGWPDDLPVWTGSCPCQPFSRGGKGKAQKDIRHLWPTWSDLIKKCQPPILFGEQVEAAIAHGWLDEVANDLEHQGYAFGSSVLSTFAVESPDNRERIFFVGDCEYNGQDGAQAVGGIAASILNSEKGEEIPIKLTGASASRVLSYGDIQWKKYPHGLSKAIKPGICLLADGIPSRMAEIHAFGNAINPEIAAQFIKAVMEIKNPEVVR